MIERALVVLALVLPASAAAQDAARLDRLKEEATRGVEGEATLVQRIVDQHPVLPDSSGVCADKLKGAA